MAKYGYLPAFWPILTESPSILRIRNRRGIQSKWHFSGVLKFQTPGGVQKPISRIRETPRGVDVKDPSAARSGSGNPGIPGIPGYGVPGSPWGRPGTRLGSPARRSGDRGPRSPGIGGPGGLGSPGSRKGLPRPRGRAPEGLFYINPSRRGPAPGRGVPGRQSRPGAPFGAARPWRVQDIGIQVIKVFYG